MRKIDKTHPEDLAREKASAIVGAGKNETKDFGPCKWRHPLGEQGREFKPRQTGKNISRRRQIFRQSCNEANGSIKGDLVKKIKNNFQLTIHTIESPKRDECSKLQINITCLGPTIPNHDSGWMTPNTTILG